MPFLECAEKRERVRVVRPGAHLAIKSRHRLEVVVHDVGWRLGQDIERAVMPPAEIRHEDFDPRDR